MSDGKVASELVLLKGKFINLYTIELLPHGECAIDEFVSWLEGNELITISRVKNMKEEYKKHPNHPKPPPKRIVRDSGGGAGIALLPLIILVMAIASRGC